MIDVDQAYALEWWATGNIVKYAWWRGKEYMIGKRIYPNDEGPLVFAEQGCYGKDKDGLWWCRPPKGGAGVLSDHEVVEHEDGTITVSPSILMEGVWHGFLEHGVWREA